MTAVDAAQVQFMKRAGMPLTTEAKLTYTAIVPGKSIAYTHRADFISGVEPYDVGNKVEFFAEGDNVRMILTLGPMHSEEWTQRASDWHGEPTGEARSGHRPPIREIAVLGPAGSRRSLWRRG